MPPRKNNAPALVAAASTAEVPSAVEAQEPEAVVEPHVLTDIDRLMRGGGRHVGQDHYAVMSGVFQHCRGRRGGANVDLEFRLAQR